MKVKLFILIVSILPLFLSAQKRAGNYNRYVSLMPSLGKVEIHSKYVDNLLGSYPRGLSLDFGKHYFDESSKKTYGCFPRQGLILTFWDFDKKILGYGLSGMYYFEPFLYASNRFMISLRGSMGLIYMTNPYDETDNPTNLAYSLPVSFPVSVGINMYYPLSYQWALKMNGSINHFSNSGLKQPNYGVNYSTLALGVEYSFDRYHVPPREHSQMLFVNEHERDKYYELVTGIGSKDISGTGIEKSQLIMFLHGRYMHQWTRINGWCAGLLFEYEDVFQSFSKKYVSPLLGHEFLLGNFTLTQEMGYAFQIDPFEFSRLFQIYALQYQFEYHFNMGVSLKAHGGTADYAAIRFGLKL